jgi:hypothetical protein
MFYSDTQLFLNFLRILNRLEVDVFARAVKFESPCTLIFLERPQYTENNQPIVLTSVRQRCRHNFYQNLNVE